MGTLVLHAQDQLSPHHNFSTKMGLFSPHHTTPTKQQRKPQRTTSTSSHFSPNPITYAERNLSEMGQCPAREKSPTVLPSASSNISASSKALQSLSASHKFRPLPLAGEMSFLTKPYFQSDCVSVAECDQPQRPASASGIVRPEADKKSRLGESNSASAKISVARNSSSRRTNASPEIMSKKQEHYLKATKRLVGGKAFEHSYQGSMGLETGFTLTDKSRSRSVNKKILQRTIVEEVSNTDAVRCKVLHNVPMKVTILQRPKTKEDALQNLSKLTGVPLAELFAKGLTAPFPGSGPAIADNKNLGFEKMSSAGGKEKDSTQNESNKSMKSSQLLSVSSQEVTDPSSAVREQKSLDFEDDPFGIQEEERSFSVYAAIQEEGRSISVDLINSLPVSLAIDCNESSAMALSSDAEFLAEKWAGPCFTISPPPSSLPIPKFARRMTAIPDIDSADEREGVSSSGSASASPLEEGLWQMNIMKGQDVKRNILDTAVATKDLRRLLKLVIS